MLDEPRFGSRHPTSPSRTLSVATFEEPGRTKFGDESIDILLDVYGFHIGELSRQTLHDSLLISRAV